MNKCPVCGAEETKGILTELYPVVLKTTNPPIMTHSMDIAVACAKCGLIRLVPREFDFQGNPLTGGALKE